MRILVTFLFLIFALFSCSENEDPTPNSPTKQVETVSSVKKDPVVKKEKSTPPKKVVYPKLTNENSVAFLTKYGQENKETVIRLSCDYGDIDIKLYTNTPIHRANMIYLTKQGYFDLTQFYRVSKNFVDQAGNSDEWDCQLKRAEIGGYTLPSEFNTQNIHKYGSVAMARRYDKNPKKRSSAFEFYISLGRARTKAEVRAHEREFGTSYSPEQYKIYMDIGGNPFLDMEHTVIGEVIKGMDVAEELNKVEVDGREWPLTEIGITMKVLR